MKPVRQWVSKVYVQPIDQLALFVCGSNKNLRRPLSDRACVLCSVFLYMVPCGAYGLIFIGARWCGLYVGAVERHSIICL
jgi:hypothetical protein